MLTFVNTFGAESFLTVGVLASLASSSLSQFIASIDDAGLVDVGLCSSDMYGICDTFDISLRTYCEENGLLEEDEYEEWDE